MKKIILLLITLLPLSLSATPTAKTFYRQSISPTWLDPFTLTTPHEEPPVDGMRSALHVEPFYWRSTNKKTMGRYFGYYESTTDTTYNHLRVDADASETSLTPQDIIHDATNAAAFLSAVTNPLAETLTFNPRIEQYGALITTSTHFGSSLVVHALMPWTHVEHSLGLVKSDTVPQLVEGTVKTVSDFFTGNVVQEEATSPDQQDRLMYGKLTNTQSRSGLSDITLLVQGKLVNTPHTNVTLGGIATLPTGSRSTGQYLFEPSLGAGGHVVLGAELNLDVHLGSFKKEYIVDGLFSLSHRIGIDGHETRSASYQFAVDNGIDAQFSRYALAGKKHTRRLFPLINVLTQPVNVSPGSATDLALGICGSFRWLHARLMYRFAHSEPETVTPLVEWPAQEIGISRLDYAQTTAPEEDGDPLNYHTFNPATHSSMVTGGLNEENILFAAAATPAQTAHTFGVTLAGMPFKKFPHSSFALRGHYSFVHHNSFGLAGFGLSAAFVHTF